jgi:hypothetical protein
MCNANNNRTRNSFMLNKPLLNLKRVNVLATYTMSTSIITHPNSLTYL